MGRILSGGRGGPVVDPSSVGQKYRWWRRNIVRDTQWCFDDMETILRLSSDDALKRLILDRMAGIMAEYGGGVGGGGAAAVGGTGAGSGGGGGGGGGGGMAESAGGVAESGDGGDDDDDDDDDELEREMLARLAT